MLQACVYFGSRATTLRNEKMIDESLKTYRQERRAFIVGLQHYFDIDFYRLDKRKRSEWLRTYIESKREFFENLVEHWRDNPQDFDKAFPDGYKRKGKRYVARSKR